VPSVDADHEHSRAADTPIVLVPPWAGRVPPPFKATVHRERDEGAVVVLTDDPHAETARPPSVASTAEMKTRA
jgi:hypothetical protein